MARTSTPIRAGKGFLFARSNPALAGALSLLFLLAVGALLVRQNRVTEAGRREEAVTVEPPTLAPQVDDRAGHYYRVRSGDTLEGLARRFYRNPLAWQRIAGANAIVDPRRLRAGNVIWIPEPRP